jgi:hypothetical protein
MKRLLLLSALMIAAGQVQAVGHLADIGVYDRNQQRSLPVYWHEGRAYVVGNPGNEYQVTLRNQAGQDLLAVVSVDGVNVVSGETATASQSGYVLNPWQDFSIKGWRKSLARTAAFYFTALPDSYAARTGRPDNVGVIGVALFQRKAYEPPVWLNSPPAPYRYDEHAKSTSPEAMPRDEAAASLQNQSGLLNQQSMQPRSAEKLGTGHGRNETSYVRETTFERASPYPSEVVTIYYDSYANLVARGVITAQLWREPQPFPGRFVPDPPRRW